MGKRSDFIRIERDFYPTPLKAIEPLLPHLDNYTSYAEPMAGDGSLINGLNQMSDLSCEWSSDIEPRGPDIKQANIFDITLTEISIDTDVIITNPPWSRETLHQCIMHLSAIRPSWLLFDADWMHNVSAKPFLPFCHKIQSVGRVKWFPESKHTGKDNVCWYLFDQNKKSHTVEFYPRGWL
jgi:hypothetical protein